MGVGWATVTYHPVGIVRSEHVCAEQTPIQPVYAKGCRGRVEVLAEFEEGLRDIEGFSHVYLIYHMHEAGPAKMVVKPFLEDVERGVFSTRAPCRPNPIGLSIVELLGREGRMLYLDCLDLLDGTPVLDIKPYTARFDCIPGTRNGWQDGIDEMTSQERGRRKYGGGECEP